MKGLEITILRYGVHLTMDIQLYCIIYVPGTVRLQSDVRIQFVWHHLCCSCLLRLALGTRNKREDTGRYEQTLEEK